MEENKIVIYKDKNNSIQLEVKLDGDMVWLTRQQIATLFGRDYKTISKHINNALKEELADEVVVAKFENTTQHGAIEGKTQTHELEYFNLEMVTSVGYRVKSSRGVQFRKWANRIVGDYTIRGYVLDKERFKNGTPLSSEYFEHLLEDIREIRLSERKFYQKVTDLYATAVDYDGTALRTRRFFATVQNKMHQAVNGLTAAQIIYSRADAEKEHMGLTTWEQAPRGKIRKSDVVIAKNYLADDELGMLERMVNAYLEFAENRAKQHIPMTMEDWETRLDKFISIWDGPITMEQVENVTAAMAQSHAESEFEKYRIVQDRLFMSDYDRYLLALEKTVRRKGHKEEK